MDARVTFNAKQMAEEFKAYYTKIHLKDFTDSINAFAASRNTGLLSWFYSKPENPLSKMIMEGLNSHDILSQSMIYASKEELAQPAPAQSSKPVWSAISEWWYGAQAPAQIESTSTSQLKTSSENTSNARKLILNALKDLFKDHASWEEKSGKKVKWKEDSVEVELMRHLIKPLPSFHENLNLKARELEAIADELNYKKVTYSEKVRFFQEAPKQVQQHHNDQQKNVDRRSNGPR